MQLSRNIAGVTALFIGCFAAGWSAALTVNLPADAQNAREVVSGPSTYRLPIGAFDNGDIPTRQAQGSIRKQAWRVPSATFSTFDLMADLRNQLEEQGFRPVFECETSACGGYDFRYGIDTLPEPEMHVDLGDFRFLSAEKDGAVASVLVSRSSAAGFAQIVHVDPAFSGETLTGSTMSSRPAPLDSTGEEPFVPSAGPVAALLDQRGTAVLEGVDFASGSSELQVGATSVLDEIGAWLSIHTDATIALVGHTDTSGSLEANIALSEKRARSVRQRLIDIYGIAPNRIEAKGVGFLSPRDTNSTEEGRRKNRRVEVIVTSTPSSQ